MKAAVLKGPSQLSIEDVPIPVVKNDEVLIGVVKAGICGTDVEVFTGGYVVPLPRVIGHEYSGIIAAIGNEVEGLKIGDLVTSEGSWACGNCASCNAGKSYDCSMKHTLGRSEHGVFTEYVKVPSSIVYKLPNGVTHTEAQSTVNLACAVRAVRRATIKYGDHVVLIGSGHAALLLLQVLKTSGAGRVTVIGGERRKRLNLAATLGADEVIAAKTKIGRERIEDLSQDASVDIVIEASGSPDQLEQALWLVKQGGKVVMFSIFPKKISEFEANILYQKELQLCGTRGGGDGYSVALDLLKAKRVVVEPLVSHEFNLMDTDVGMRLMAERDSSVVRIIISV